MNLKKKLGLVLGTITLSITLATTSIHSIDSNKQLAKEIPFEFSVKRDLAKEIPFEFSVKRDLAKEIPFEFSVKRDLA